MTCLAMSTNETEELDYSGLLLLPAPGHEGFPDEFDDKQPLELGDADHGSWSDAPSFESRVIREGPPERIKTIQQAEVKETSRLQEWEIEEIVKRVLESSGYYAGRKLV